MIWCFVRLLNLIPENRRCRALLVTPLAEQLQLEIMSEVHPVSLDKTESRSLRIVWNDGVEQVLPYQRLRQGCQCANCMEKRKAQLQDEQHKDPTALPVLSAAETVPLDIVRMRPVGNYAYNIEFSDGHTTGLFTYELLRSLSE